MAAESRYPAPGEVVDGKYRIEKMLGEGGMGAVAGATHLLRKAPVALKFISPDVIRVPGAVERFINEAVAASAIDSDHVVRIYDVGRLPTGLPFIVMEMMSGCDLEELLKSEGGGGGLPTPRAVHFVLQILRALQVAHAAGIIHRDLKPSNAFVVMKDGEPDFVKLLDFGISKIQQDASESSQSLTQTNTGLGTPLYMSPEQARNARDANARSDIYSVGAILYELLSGRTPYQAETPNDLLFKLFTSEPDPLQSVQPSVPADLATLVHLALAKDPSLRPGSAYDLAELLAPFADDRSAGILSRIRSAQGAAGRGSALPSTPPPAMSQARGSVTGMERTMLDTAASSRTASTQLNVEAERTQNGSPKRSPVVPAIVALVVVGGLVAGGIALSGRKGGDAVAPAHSETAQTASQPARAPDSPTAATSQAKSPEVAPAIDSAVPPPASTSVKKPAGPGGAPPPGGGGGGKKNPFGVGIVQ